MKNKIVIAALLLLNFAFITSCTEGPEAYSTDGNNDFSSFKSYVTLDNTSIGTKQINVDSYIGFYDLSFNAIGHEWRIPESAKFLNNNFTEDDSIYTKFILPTNAKVSNEELINVLFTESGIKEVKLVNSFQDSVPQSVKVDDEWVVDRTFTVDVFANPVPTGKVYRQNYIPNPADPTGPTIWDESNPYSEILFIAEGNNPKVEEMGSWDEVIIEAGEKLKFEDLSTIGRVDAVRWYVEGGKPETSGNLEAEITYNKLGNYTAWFESKRTNDVGPSKETSKLIPLKIKVIASSKPFVINGGVKMDENQVISFAVTGEMEAIVGQTDKFTVNVKNEAASFDQDIAVATVEINSEDATIIELTLSEPVFNTDEITISYAGGTIESVDARNLGDFGPEPVKQAAGASILAEGWASFEDENAGNWKSAFALGHWVGNTNDDNGSTIEPIFSRTTELAFSGEASMRYTYDLKKSIQLQGSNFAKPGGKSTPIEAGTYKISYKVFLENGNTMKAFTNVLTSPFTVMEWDVSTIERGEWVELSRIVTVTNIAGGTKFHLKVDPASNPGVTGEQTIYFDDLQWVKLNERM
ncbi:SwmB domain-containing protein [Flavicella sediminum]|uniref:SwmB domain-containing protein n=1 Tax=Flavicella sediminum TaxID=2585141 RepID=UPI00111FB0D1|nr:SwmB domain-containing protein [Flavicella sediminum]